MDPRRNPYAPGAGNRPPEFAGRETLLANTDIAYDRLRNGLHAQDIMLLGLRGVGKTVLLNRLHQDAKAKGIETIRIEVPDASGGHLAPILVPFLNATLRKLDRIEAMEATLTRAAAVLRNFASIFRVKLDQFSFEVAPAGGADTGLLETDLPDLLVAVAEAARARRTCLSLFVDEVQYLDRTELSALARACHEASQQGEPFLFVGAGLPQLAALTGDAKSYAERLFSFAEVGALSVEDATVVLTAPAARQGVSFTQAALDLIYEETAGYPFFLQTWGKFSWDEAEGDTITSEDVANARPFIIAFLDQSFFRVRFDRCSEAEQRYLRGMAELGPGPHRSGEIAATLGTTSDRLGATRKSLIELGMIYSQRHGETAFTVPLFDGFMKRAIPDLQPHTPRRNRA
ncbi:MAG: ATP-binding protein [Pseudomonadota bacterium]